MYSEHKYFPCLLAKSDQTSYLILIYLKNNPCEVSSPLDFSSRNNDSKLVPGVSNLADIRTLQNIGLCNFLIPYKWALNVLYWL